MDQTRPNWLIRPDGSPIHPETSGTGIFLFSSASGVRPRKRFRTAMTYAQCLTFAASQGVQEFKWVPEHVAHLSFLQSTPCGQRCNARSGCDGGCLCNELTGICE